ncbi:MAG: hypothetical protein JO189_19690 [Deltaproteobacteria bacterium]|nr:hypothetical protein [Deltaproteobacteria bacterium]
MLRCTVAQDAGRAIHPNYVEGQMQGDTTAVGEPGGCGLKHLKSEWRDF